MKGEQLKLLTLLKTRRKTEMQPYRVRSKFIVIPPKVVEGKAINFINILRTNFLYERHLGSFFYV